MRIGDIIHKIAEIVDMVEQPEGTNVTATGNDKEPEDLFVPPLQQKMELLKKVAGVDSVYDKPGEGDDSDDEVAIMKRNAGLPMMTMVASEDEDGLEN